MPATTPHRVRGLRANALAAVAMLLIQYSLGMMVNLYSTLPGADRGSGVFDGFGAAVANGPVVLTIHALLGTLLLFTASGAVIRAVRLGATRLIWLSGVALVAMLVAWLSGATFVGKMNDGSSLAMALAAAVALLCYVVVIFILSLQPNGGQRTQGMEVRP